MSTYNTCNPEECLWVKPKVHPCRKRYSQISDSEWDHDYVDLLNSVQRHSKCISAYYLRQNENNSQYCRFAYPFGQGSKTHLVFEKVHSKDGAEKYRTKVVTARNDPRMNRYQRLQLQGWRANCDTSVVMCLIKHASKGEKLSSVVQDAFVSVVSNVTEQTDTTKTIKQLMMKAVGQREMSVQEVMHQLLSLKLFSSSFQVMAVSLDGSHKLKINNNDVIAEPSLLDNYGTHDNFRTGHPDTLSCNFVQFVSQYYVNKDNCLKKRVKSVVVHTFPNHSSLQKVCSLHSIVNTNF